MTNQLISELKDIYPFTPCEAPEFDAFSVAGMDFTTKGWDAQGLGRVSLMEAGGMGGAMTMTALIVNPIEIDAPLFNLDLISLPGKKMLYMELYDTLLAAPRNEAPFAAVRADYGDIMDLPGKPCWYDDIRYGASVTKCAMAGQEGRLDELMARYGEDGLLYYAGRRDFQIKRHGRRVELTEIESAIHTLEGVQRACVIHLKDEQKLIACYTGEEMERKVLNKLLQTRLPDYMIPDDYLHLTQLPLTSHGKIDRRQLQQTYLDAREASK